jgi:hypothetical protein
MSEDMITRQNAINKNWAKELKVERLKKIDKNKPYINNEQAWDIYVKSYYFACTTMTTVGYGDFSASRNTIE